MAAASISEAARRRRQIERTLYLAPSIAFLLIFIVLPYLAVFRMSFNTFSPMRLFVESFTFDNYVGVLSDPYYYSLIFRTLLLGTTVTLATLVLGLPLALKIAASGRRMKSLLMALVLSPLLINLVVRTYAWLVVLGDKGLINEFLLGTDLAASPIRLTGSFFSVWLGLTHITLPLMVLSLVGVLEKLDRRVFEAATSLGAGEWFILRRVTLPLVMPGIGAGALLVFCFTVSAFITPALLGGSRVGTVSTVIFEKFTYSMNWPVGSALVFVLLIINMGVIWLHGRIFGEHA
ncbi:MAG: ABC transporter permease [Azospirillum sp.]|nr:ABC transporter permease [Azospirillum sp.]